MPRLSLRAYDIYSSWVKSTVKRMNEQPAPDAIDRVNKEFSTIKDGAFDIPNETFEAIYVYLMHQVRGKPSDDRCLYPNSPCWAEPTAPLGRLVSMFPNKIIYPGIDLVTFDRLHAAWFKRLDAAMAMSTGNEYQARLQFLMNTYVTLKEDANDIVDHRLKCMFITGTCRVVAWYAGISEEEVRNMCADYYHLDAWDCKQPPYYLYQCFEMRDA